MEWINQIKKIFRHTNPKLEADNFAPIPPRQLVKILESIENIHENESDCEKINRILDQFAELTIRGEDAAQILPVVKAHLKLCQDCQEEYEALLKILQSQDLS